MPKHDPTKPPCSHHVYPSKYEQNSPEIQNWWYKLFQVMEAEASIPPDRRIDVLEDIFPEKVLNQVLRILNIEAKGAVSEKQVADVKRALSTISVPSDTTLRSGTEFQRTESELIAGKDRNEIGKINPYTHFFNRRADRAAIWHTLPPLSYEEMNLWQKAEAVTEAIAIEFVKWMIAITKKKASECVSVSEVLKLFEIGFNTHAAQSLQVRIREMLTVPTGVAILRGMPEMQKRSQMNRLIVEDIAASKKRERIFAFGTKLAPEDQVIPPKQAEVGKWMSCSRIPRKLQTMAAVFQGITHLKSTRAFCEHLAANPHIQRPIFLMNMDMFNPLVLKRSDHAFEIEPEVDNISQFSHDQPVADDNTSNN